MNWGCCEQPNLTWHFEGDTASLMCDNCNSHWTPASLVTGTVENENGAYGEVHLQPLVMAQDPHYQMAWQTLLKRIDTKSSWGKNLLKDLMLDCLTAPEAFQAEPDPTDPEEVTAATLQPEEV